MQGLKDKISAEYPNLRELMSSVLITINREYAFDDAVIPRMRNWQCSRRFRRMTLYDAGDIG